MFKGAVGSVQFTTVFLVQLLFILCHLSNALCNFQFLQFDKIGKSPKMEVYISTDYWHTVHVTTCDVNIAVALSGPRCVVPTIYWHTCNGFASNARKLTYCLIRNSLENLKKTHNDGA